MKANLGYSLEVLFPKLSSCPNLEVRNNEFDLNDFCYLKQDINIGFVDVAFRSTNEFGGTITLYSNEDILSACE